MVFVLMLRDWRQLDNVTGTLMLRVWLQGDQAGIDIGVGSFGQTGST